MLDDFSAGYSAAKRRVVPWLVLAVLATLVAVFYLEEDWRGKRAWENCKRELEAKGVVLDWDKFIPPPVPDDQNFYTASTNIALKFVKARNEAESEAASRLPWFRLPLEPKIIIAEVTVISSNTDAIPDDADLYLHYDHSVLTVATSHDDFSEPQSPLLPVFDLKDVPLKSAIEQVAQAAKLNYTIDSKVNSVDSKGKPILLTVRWENVTARQALLALLDNFGLVLVKDSKTGTARILQKNGPIYAEPDVTKRIGEMLSGVLEQSTNGFQGAILQGAAGVWLFTKSPRLIKPAHIVVRAEEIPSVQEMSEIFSKNTAESKGTNSFRIYGNPRVVSAEDYLKWSDQYVPAFDEVREALKRPYAIIPGDYSVPYLIPIPNFVTLRMAAQALAQRAQCDFLLGRPEDALREVTLIHDLCRILEKPPAGKPITLVEAMINVAISGLYTTTVAEGFKLNAWREPQIAMLQTQFKEKNLASTVYDSCASELAATTCTIEKTLPSKIAELFGTVDVASGKNTRSFWKKINDPMYLFFKLCPRGWIYQNMLTTASSARSEDGVDLEHKTISPQFIEKPLIELEKSLNHATPFIVWARIAIPNFTKAWQTTAHNQTMVNEGQIVCALERYHLAHGEYPEMLDALSPQFIEKIPHDIIGGQPLHYRRTADGKFLLYSVGWNETDDGGLDGGNDFTKADWIWKN